MKYELLALDIDGTLVKEHTHTISPSVVDAIRKAQEQVIVTLVSARAKNDQQKIIDQLGLNHHYHVLENGAKVINPQGEIENAKYLSAAEVPVIQDLAMRFCESIGYCVEGNWSTELPLVAEVAVTTMSVIVKNNLAPKITDLLQRLPSPHSMTTGSHWSDKSLSVILISHPEASKGNGLHYIQTKLGISVAQTIAVGDGGSDVPMMKFAGLKIAMGNAEEQLKQVTTEIAPAVSEDGVAAIISHYILNNL